MPLGYKYVERDATSYVDWNAIGKNMTDMLKEEMSIREQKKKAIDDASVELGNVFENAPQGTNKPMNEWALEFASDGQKARLLQDRLLKSGYLKLKDYTIQRQNLNDGTDQAFKLSKQYQDEYKSTMDAYNSSNPDEQIQDLNIFLMKSIEGFSNFSQTRLVINPKDGSVGARKLVIDPTTGKPKMGANGLPEFSDNPNDFATINSLNKWMQQKYAKFNVEKNVKEFVGSLGSEINTISKLGGIHHFGTTTETLNIANRKYFPKNDQAIIMKFEEAEKLALQSRLDTPYKTSSVLTNSLIYAPNGKQYDFTWDETEAKNDDHFILLKVDPNGQGAPMPQPTEKQQSDALRYLTVQARLQYDKEVKIKQEDQLARNDARPPTEDEANRKNDLKEKETAVGVWGDIFKSGTIAEKNAKVQTLLGTKRAQDKGLIDVDFGKNGEVTFIYGKNADGNKINPDRTIKYDPDNITLQQWNELGNEIHGIDNVKDVMKRTGGGDPNAKMSTAQKTFTGVKASRTEQKNPEVEFSSKISSINNEAFKKKDKQATKDFANSLKGTGIVVVPNVGVNPYNTVNLKYGDKTYKVSVNLDDDEVQAEKDNFTNWVESTVPASVKQDMLDKGLIGGGGDQAP